jgi:hypothetical protein
VAFGPGPIVAGDELEVPASRFSLLDIVPILSL